MKKLPLVLALLCVPVFAGAEPQEGASHKGMSILDVDATQAAAVTKLWAEFTKAFNKHDPKAMAAIWALDGDHVEPDGTTAKGRAEVEQLFRKEHEVIFQSATLTLKLGSVWMVTDDVALADGSYEITGAVDPEGEELGPRKGKLTSVLMREDGRWQVAASRLMIPVPLVWRPDAQPAK